MEIIPLGDSAVVVRVREQFEDAPEETLDEVLQIFQQLRSAAIPGVIEVAPAYVSVAVFYDPVQVGKVSGQPDRTFHWLKEQLLRVIAAAAKRGQRRRTRRNSKSVEIPVCYDSEFAPDVDDVARHTQIS